METTSQDVNEGFLTKHKGDDKESLFGKSQFIIMRHAESTANFGMTKETAFHEKYVDA